MFVDTDEGVTGESLLWTFGTKRLDVLNSMVLSLKADVLGEDPHYTERIWRKLWSELGFFGVEGISVFGLSAIDRACWDAVGKAAGKPLYKLLGAYRDEVPTYIIRSLVATEHRGISERGQRFFNGGLSCYEDAHRQAPDRRRR